MLVWIEPVFPERANGSIRSSLNRLVHTLIGSTTFDRDSERTLKLTETLELEIDVAENVERGSGLLNDECNGIG